MGSYKPISRVAIIGAGPSGLAAAKYYPCAPTFEAASDVCRYLLAEHHFDRIDVFEQRSGIGGIWNLSSTVSSKNIPIPQIDPRYGFQGKSISHNGEINHASGHQNDQGLEFESPLYDYLETNIPKQLMAYSDQLFDDDLPLFPRHQDVLKYLQQYASDVLHLIRFKTHVVKVKLKEMHQSDQWEVVTEHVETGKRSTATYDAVVVANGHYTIPHVPDIPGIQAWNILHPGIIIHSKAYRRPEDFRDKKVIVVGNSASGTDISAQIAQYCKHPLLLSSRSHNELFPGNGSESQEDVSEIAEFLGPDEGGRAVRFKDGRVESEVDAIIFATGYFFNFPFLELPSQLVTDGFRTRGVYQHLFHIENPTLAFLVLNMKVIPFPLAENQAAVVSRVWSGRLSLPSKEKMREWERERLQERGSGKEFHMLKHPEDAEVLNELYEWAGRAEKVEGMENGGVGKQGMYWDERSVLLRSKFPEIKAEFAKKGTRRSEVKTLAELGFAL